MPPPAITIFKDFLSLIVMLLLGTSAATYVSVLGGLAVVMLTLRKRLAFGVVLLGLAAAVIVSNPQETSHVVFSIGNKGLGLLFLIISNIGLDRSLRELARP